MDGNSPSKWTEGDFLQFRIKLLQRLRSRYRYRRDHALLVFPMSTTCLPQVTFHSPIHTDPRWMGGRPEENGHRPGLLFFGPWTDLRNNRADLWNNCMDLIWISHKQYRQSKSRSGFLNWRRLPLLVYEGTGWWHRIFPIMWLVFSSISLIACVMTELFA